MQPSAIAKTPMLIASTLLTIFNLTITTKSAVAEEIPLCEPPQPSEYLLLVETETAATQEQVRSRIPPTIETTLCKYGQASVMRVGAFPNQEVAGAWAEYVNQTTGLTAVLVTSSGEVERLENAPAFNPQQLGSGYAVLVDYFNQTEIAKELKQELGNAVGLVSYGQRPYLLALHSSDPETANATLRQLSDRGFWVMLVDSRNVIRLSAEVSTTP